MALHEETRRRGGASGEARIAREHAWVLALVCAAQLLLQLDFSIVNVALPAVQRDLGFSAATLQWIVTGYAVTYGSLLLAAGRLGDLFGHRRTLDVGLVAFAVASLAGGFAATPVMLVVARLVQGAGAALIAPAALATLTGTFTLDRERAHALGIFQAATAGGATAGIVLGGFLVQVLGWRSVLLVNPPIVAALLVLVRRHVPERRDADRDSRLGVAGALLATAMLAALVGGMSEGERLGLRAPAALGLLAAAAVLAVAFTAGQLRSVHPMVPRALFASRMRVGALVVTTVEFGIVVGYVYFISLYLQRTLRFSPILTGVSLVPATLTVMLTSMLVSGRWLRHLGVRLQLALGLLVVAGGQAALSLVAPHSPYALVVVPGLVLTAFGMGLSIPAAAFAANSGVSAPLRGSAGGLFVTAQQAGAAVGLAVLAALADATTRHSQSLTAGFDRAYLVSAGLAAADAALALALIPAKRPAVGAR